MWVIEDGCPCCCNKAITQWENEQKTKTTSN